MIEHHYFASISVGSIYILKMSLPILTTISKCLQAGLVLFAKIVPTLQYAKEQLKEQLKQITQVAQDFFFNFLQFFL